VNNGVRNAQRGTGSIDWCGTRRWGAERLLRKTRDRSSVAGRRCARRVNGGFENNDLGVFHGRCMQPGCAGRDRLTDRLRSTKLGLRRVPGEVKNGLKAGVLAGSTTRTTARCSKTTCQHYPGTSKGEGAIIERQLATRTRW